jgi:flavin-dependent dehydrogenase
MPADRLPGECSACDVAIIGGGPAGASAAIRLAGAGLRIVLVDHARFPRSKVCGCCINDAALGLLSELGVAGEVRAAGAAPLHSLHLSAGRRSIRVATRPGAALSRSALDCVLTSEAERRGVTFVHGVSARVEPGGVPSGRIIVLAGAGSTHRLRARAVIVADGLGGSALRGFPEMAPIIAGSSRIGVGAQAPDSSLCEAGTVRMCCAGEGYVGLVRLEGGCVDIAAALNPGRVRALGGPAVAVARILERNGVRLDTSELRWRGTPALTRRRAIVEVESLFVIGDAAGYVEPFTGEGISWAIWSGIAAADCVGRLLRGGYEAGSWTAARADALRSRQRACWVVSTLLRSPGVLAAALAVASTAPALVKHVASTFGAPWRAPPHTLEPAG